MRPNWSRRCAVGLVPAPESLDLTGLLMAEAGVVAALDVDDEEWTAELGLIQESELADLETRLPG